jgi:hypothetical protein
MYSKEKILEILEAYDLTKSFRSAAALTGCDHHTVARYVAARAAGLDPSAGGDRGDGVGAVRGQDPTSGSTALMGVSAPMSFTRSSKRWAIRVRSARPAGWWR